MYVVGEIKHNNNMKGVNDMNDIIGQPDAETCLERLVGNINVERLDGSILENVEMYRREKLEDPNDTESVYEVEYVALTNDDVPEEIFLGDDKLFTITIKERSLK